MKKRSPYVSNLPPKVNREDSKMWICCECKETQNENGTCANIANDLCPKCFNKKLKDEWVIL